MYDLRIRMCPNGMKQDSTLEDLYSPICLINSLRITMALAAAFHLILSLFDVINAYQNIILSLD